METINSPRRWGKVTEFKQYLGKQVYDACNGGLREFVVAGPSGCYRVKVTKMRKPKGK